MHILLVEDEQAIGSALSRGLSRSGFSVEHAMSIALAREAIEKQQPDLLLTDLKLPDGSGLDLAADLGVPFIVMSGYAAFDDAVRALRLGCLEFFTKPVSIKALRDVIEKLSLRSQQRQWQIIEQDEQGAWRRVRVEPTQIAYEDLRVGQASWATQEEAHECFEELSGLCRDNTEQQLLSEVLQATDCGRVVINNTAGVFMLHCEASIDWESDIAQRDRMQLLQQRADRCLARENGVLLERYHD